MPLTVFQNHFQVPYPEKCGCSHKNSWQYCFGTDSGVGHITCSCCGGKWSLSTLLSACPSSLQYKLCKVKKIIIGTKGIPHLVTHDARTIRYPDPNIKVNDTVRIDLDNGKITDFIKFDSGRFPHWEKTPMLYMYEGFLKCFLPAFFQATCAW